MPPLGFRVEAGRGGFELFTKHAAVVLRILQGNAEGVESPGPDSIPGLSAGPRRSAIASASLAGIGETQQFDTSWWNGVATRLGRFVAETSGRCNKGWGPC